MDEKMLWTIKQFSFTHVYHLHVGKVRVLEWNHETEGILSLSLCIEVTLFYLLESSFYIA